MSCVYIKIYSLYVYNMFTFFGKKKEGRELSNFYKERVTVDGRHYSSGEHAFHGSKYIEISKVLDGKRKLEFEEYGKKFEEEGEFGMMEGNEVKKRGGKGKDGKKLNEEEVGIWTKRSVEVQEKICMYKVENDENVKKVLLGTTSKILIHPAMRCSEEKVKDKFWEGKGIMKENGEIVVLGRNMLGSIWMDVRSSLI